MQSLWHKQSLSIHLTYLCFQLNQESIISKIWHHHSSFNSTAAIFPKYRDAFIYSGAQHSEVERSCSASAYLENYYSSLGHWRKKNQQNKPKPQQQVQPKPKKQKQETHTRKAKTTPKNKSNPPKQNSSPFLFWSTVSDPFFSKRKKQLLLISLLSKHDDVAFSSLPICVVDIHTHSDMPLLIFMLFS